MKSPLFLAGDPFERVSSLTPTHTLNRTLQKVGSYFDEGHHARRLVSRFVDYYNEDRCHLSLNKDPPNPRPVQARPSRAAEVVAIPRAACTTGTSGGTQPEGTATHQTTQHGPSIRGTARRVRNPGFSLNTRLTAADSHLRLSKNAASNPYPHPEPDPPEGWILF